MGDCGFKGKIKLQNVWPKGPLKKIVKILPINGQINYIFYSHNDAIKMGGGV
jgi:hypothetical protein